MNIFKATFTTILAFNAFNSQAQNITPNLSSSTLYTSIAKECQTIDLNNWSHPTREVLIKYKAKIIKVELCNNKKYPIFTIKGLAFDLSSQPNEKSTRDFFYALLKANAKWDYAVIDTDSQVISTIHHHKEKKDFTFSYDQEFYQTP